MKTLIKWTVLVAMICCMALPSLAGDKATPKEVVQKVQEAVKLLAEKGDEALPLFKDKNGPFVWKDTYVVVLTMDGKILAHPFLPKLEGRNMTMSKDAKGKLFQAEANNIVKEKGAGWMDFYWVKPGEKAPSPKVSYCMAVPGRDMQVNAGVYDFTKADAEAQSK